MGMVTLIRCPIRKKFAGIGSSSSCAVPFPAPKKCRPMLQTCTPLAQSEIRIDIPSTMILTTLTILTNPEKLLLSLGSQPASQPALGLASVVALPSVCRAPSCCSNLLISLTPSCHAPKDMSSLIRVNSAPARRHWLPGHHQRDAGTVSYPNLPARRLREPAGLPHCRS